MNVAKAQWAKFCNQTEKENPDATAYLQDQLTNPAKSLLETQIRIFYRYNSTFGGFDLTKFVTETEFAKSYGALLADHPMYELFSTQPLIGPCGLIIRNDGTTDSIAAQTHRNKPTLSLQALVELQELYRASNANTGVSSVIQMTLEESWLTTLRYVLASLMETARIVKYRQPHTLKNKVAKTLAGAAHTNTISDMETMIHYCDGSSTDGIKCSANIEIVTEAQCWTQFCDPLFPAEKILSWKPQEVIFAPYYITGMLNNLDPESFSGQTISMCTRYGLKLLNQEQTVLIVR